MKILKRIIKATIWSIIIAYAAIVIMVHIPFVQEWIGTQVKSAIEHKLGTKADVGKVNIGFLNRIIIDDFSLYDKNGKQMIKSSRLAAKIDYGELVRNGRVSISSAQVFGLKAVFYQKDIASKANFQFVLDSLASKDKSKKSSLELSITSLIIRHGAIKFDRHDVAPTPSHFNLSHIDIKNISGHIAIPYYTPDSLSVSTKKLSFKDASGLDLKKAKFNFKLATNKQKQSTCSLTGLELVLPNTDIRIDHIAANFTSANGKPDMETLSFDGQLDLSKITLSDFACFAPSLKNATNPLYAKLTFNGDGHNINIRGIDLHSQDNGLRLIANGNISKTNNTLNWHVDVKHLRCSAQNAENLLETFGNNGKNAKSGKLHNTIVNLGDTEFVGDLSGSNNSLAVNGKITSGVGLVEINAKKADNHISAYINTDGINVGKLLDNDKLGILATTVNVKCDTYNGKIYNVDIDGVFPRFEYNNYSYTNITAKGIYDNSSFTGLISVDDPNGQISIEGKTYLSSSQQSTDIKGTVRNLDLSALNITDKWKGAKFDLDINADTQTSSTETNLFKGELNIRNFSMLSSEKSYNLDSLSIKALPNHIMLNSDFGHAELSGHYNLRTLHQSIFNMLHSKLPTICKAYGKTDNRFKINANINKSDWLSTLFGMPLNIDKPLSIDAYINDRNDSIKISCITNKFTYNGSLYENASLSMRTAGDTLAVNGKVKKVMDNGHRLDLDVTANALNDRLNATLHWNNNQRKKPMAGTLNTETIFSKREDGKQCVNVNIMSSHILVNDTTWNVLPSQITYSGGDLKIDRFAIEHNKQYIRIDGIATKSPTDSITIAMKDVDVSYMLDLVNFHSVRFSGYLSGEAYIKSVFYEPDAYAKVNINQFLFEEGRLGRLSADVRWNKNGKQIDIDACADEDNGGKTIIAGYVSPANNRIDLGIKADGTNIEFLESFCGAFMDNIEGKAHGAVRVHGPLNAINLTGELVADGNVRIIPTNVTYTLNNDTIHFLPDNIIFTSDTIRDRNGNIGIINGALHHKNLSNLTYDLTINTDNLLCYDTKGYGNDAFYGTAYGTGTCSIQGGHGKVNIGIDITPEENSFIEYNAASPEAISDQQFITWNEKDTKVTTDSIYIPDSTTTQKIQPADIPSDIRIDFLINMTPSATLRVLMDKNTNDYIALNGNGTIRASYFNKGTFDMFGTYLIDHGVYTLTIQNIIKKVFQFQQGGTIVFGGDPYDALLDLQAVYTVNSVPLSDLQLGNSFSSNNVRVDCLMNISGTPQSPHVDFNIDMPTVNDDAEQMVRTVINSEEEMNQQVVYLLSVGRFYLQNNNSAEQGQQNQTSLAMQSLLSGTISQQINTILGNLVKNNNWTFGANISTGDEGFNNAEYEGLLSGRLLNNRLIINGQFGYRDNANATTSFIGDFDISYLLSPNGNIALKVYNQTNDRYFTKSSLNTQGIGLMLKKDFNSFWEMFGINRKKKKKNIEK